VSKGCSRHRRQWRELLAAKAEMPHGEWAAWLKNEFAWTERTARNYMQVAEAFKTERLSDFSGLTINAEALYFLSSPSVPQSLRNDTVEQAEAGNRITLEAAEEMVAEHVAEAFQFRSERNLPTSPSFQKPRGAVFAGVPNSNRVGFRRPQIPNR
jgi:hypothetical protein